MSAALLSPFALPFVPSSPSLPLPAQAPSSAIAPGRTQAAKRAQTTRHVPLAAIARLRTDLTPAAGDLLLAQVTRPGQHQHLEHPDGRRAKLWEGDEIIVAYGNRYAPDQFEAYVPGDLEPCHLVAGGGVAARVVSQHGTMKRATELRPLGLLADAGGRRINLIDWAIPEPALQLATTARVPYVFAVLGSSMNAGKTTTAAGIIHGLTRAGHRVGAAKITGTGSGGDRWAMRDAGAVCALDFTDAGHASTFGLAQNRVEHVLERLVGALRGAVVDAIVLELADGLFQAETAALVSSPRFNELVDGVVFAADSAMGAKGGADWLRGRGLAPLAISGIVTMSPLASQEAAVATMLPVLPLSTLVTTPWWQAVGAGPAA